MHDIFLQQAIALAVDAGVDAAGRLGRLCQRGHAGHRQHARQHARQHDTGPPSKRRGTGFAGPLALTP